MKRRIIQIDTEKCNGCGACATACHEGAIGIVDGKAKLLRDDYCDGMGDCLPNCPMDAISFIEREAAAYDEQAVLAAKLSKQVKRVAPSGNGCPGSQLKAVAGAASELRTWPVQIKLLPMNAPYFADADLLIAADCTAYSYANFHRDFIRDRVTVIGCPKLDHVDYAEKLTEIFKSNAIRSVTVVRMEVPCCGGLSYAVERAIAASGKEIPCKVVILSTDGRIL